MVNILVKTTEEKERTQRLIDMKVPAYRQAYSDRTAWIMACLSELAYIKFNPLFSNLQHKQLFLENINKLVDANKHASLLKLIELLGYDHDQEKKKLEAELGFLKMNLCATFDSNGTQAILVSCESFIVLSFRGTEATSIKDIKADAKAVSVKCETKGNVHQGFKKAFEDVGFDIQETLDQDAFQSLPLYITGHSLGGALATVAAKWLSHKGGIAACYTFGAPRVGDDYWIADLKSPVYRLVNAADCVTMLPPGTETITVISWIAQYIPGIGKSIRSFLLSRFGGYLHGGYMRYLTNCPCGQFDSVELLYSVSLFYRIKGLIFKKLPWKAFLSDHSIGVYRKKLEIIAHRRNC
ncbi:MAG: lipase family protein [Proteobacteria bacterium]|nr:lipase family protein [Desulfobacula sp.]MBU3954567.1 lipase family protein [Pseudomonadota bacterium]MBU4130101.1 lipase family protein [Pseudomonadota bacterium]